MAATIAVEMMGPMPGTLINRWQLLFLLAHRLDLRADPFDSLVQRAPIVMKIDDNRTHTRGYLVGTVLQNGKE